MHKDQGAPTWSYVGLVVQIVVEHHDALVAAAAHVDIALGIHGDGMEQGELAGPRSAIAGLFDEAGRSCRT